MRAIRLRPLRFSSIFVGLVGILFGWGEYSASEWVEHASSSGAQDSAINPFKTVESFSPIATRQLRFTITKSSGGEASLDELEVYTAEEQSRNVALVSNGAQFSSSGSRIRASNDVAEKVGDGAYGNSNRRVANAATNVWIQVDFPQLESIDRVVWSRDRNGLDWGQAPVEYRIEVADVSDEWKTVASSKERPQGFVFDPVEVPQFERFESLADSTSLLPPVNVHRNIENFTPVEARFVRLYLKILEGAPMLDEVEVYTTDSVTKNVALATHGAIASSSNTNETASDPFSPLRLNDGLYGERSMWRSDLENTGWVQIQLPRVTEINRIVWSRDRLGKWTDRVPLEYRIEVATEPGQWLEVASSNRRRRSDLVDLVGDHKAPSDYIVDSWSVEDGLPLGSINDMSQTPDGYFWLATDTGLIRFDGNQFVSFDYHNTSALSTPEVPTIYVDSGGRIWVVNRKYFYDSRNNLVIYENGEFRRIEVQGKQKVLNFFEDRDRQLWVLTNKSAIPWIEGELAYDRARDGFHPQTMKYLDGESESERWLRWTGEPGKWVHGEFVPGFGSGEGIREFNKGEGDSRQFPRRDGGLWELELEAVSGAALRTDQVRRRLADGSLTESTLLPWDNESISSRAVLCDRSDNLWIAPANRGLYCLYSDGTGYSHYATGEGLNGQSFSRIFQDQDGKIWLAIKGGGLKRLRKRLFRSVDEKQGIKAIFRNTQVDNVYSVAPSSEGGVWIGTHSSGAYHWDDEVLRYLLNSYTFTWSILEDSQGTVWTGAYGLKPRRHFLQQLVTVPSFGKHPSAFLEGSQGKIWSGGDYGLFCFDQGVLFSYVPPSFAKLGFEWVISLIEDSAGAIWAGTKLGYLHRFKDGRFDGLWSAEDGSKFPVCALYIDPSGDLWMARFGFGLSRLSNGKVTHFTEAEGLPSSTINGILADSRGSLWMTSKQGVYRISVEDFKRFAAGESFGVRWQHFTEEDGLPSNQCNGEQNQPSLCMTNDGRIWIPTFKGVGFIDPLTLENPDPPPSVMIQEVIRYGSGHRGETLLSDGEFTGQQGTPPITLSIPPGNNNLLIRYTAVEFTEPDKVKFRYRLVGLENEWVDAENERSTYIASLRFGTYDYELMAVNHLGYSGEVASLRIIVQPVWWETGTFRMLLIASLLLVGFILYRNRITQLEKKNQLQAEISSQLIEREEAERKRISQELHDGLGHELL